MGTLLERSESSVTCEEESCDNDWGRGYALPRFIRIVLQGFYFDR
jgi:hypothetical protein